MLAFIADAFATGNVSGLAIGVTDLLSELVLGFLGGRGARDECFGAILVNRNFKSEISFSSHRLMVSLETNAGFHLTPRKWYFESPREPKRLMLTRGNAIFKSFPNFDWPKRRFCSSSRSCEKGYLAMQCWQRM